MLHSLSLALSVCIILSVWYCQLTFSLSFLFLPSCCKDCSYKGNKFTKAQSLSLLFLIKDCQPCSILHRVKTAHQISNLLSLVKSHLQTSGSTAVACSTAAAAAEKWSTNFENTFFGEKNQSGMKILIVLCVKKKLVLLSNHFVQKKLVLFLPFWIEENRLFKK